MTVALDASSAPALRASDADRHAVVTRLQDAVALGLLTHDEGSERMAVAYDARYLQDLPPLTADLPPTTPSPQAALAPGWRVLLAMFWLQLRVLVTGPAGRPSRRRLAVVGGLVLAVAVLLVLGVDGLHGPADAPHGHGGFAARGH